MLNEISRVRRPLPACAVCHSPTTNFASGVCNGCHHKNAVRRELVLALNALLSALDKHPERLAEFTEEWALVRATVRAESDL